MGFNVAGVLTKTKLENIFSEELKYIKEVDIEEATKMKDDLELDILSLDEGTLIFSSFEEVYDFSSLKGEYIHFMISDISDTYYFAKYIDGKLERKLVISEGEIQENIGSGIIDIEDDFMEKIIELSNKTLNVNDIFEEKFKRFEKTKQTYEFSKIGSKGENFNDSVASSSMNIEPDSEQIAMYDEYEVESKPFKIVFLIGILIVLALSIFTFKLFRTHHYIWGSILTLITIFMAGVTYEFRNWNAFVKEDAYQYGLIIPAIIVQTNPIKIIALANMCSEIGQDEIYAVKKMEIKKLPNHNIAIGEKVPCVSLFSEAVDGYRRYFEPRPICWGYKDSKHIKKANDILKNDWEILNLLKEKVKDNENEIIFFDKNLNIVEM
ncbi:DUF3239 domain-containing protein [Oceanivirga salmonicida]|uniref:DUF3239 domain-containing protein n=1 Tax=Oceanivirga salmonicida TaxID=1769291 RepID=UPI0012E15090|nr:DUF3239 domain-containing protein [Oceanivirga salmonicida]